VNGQVESLHGRVLHDDRKTVEVFMSAQGRYMRRELARIANNRIRIRDRLRLMPPLMPFLVFFYCLFGKGLVLDGRAGLFYALQRMIAEAALSLMALESRLRGKADAGTPENAAGKISSNPEYSPKPSKEA
jgi:hypothetical protein